MCIYLVKILQVFTVIKLGQILYGKYTDKGSLFKTNNGRKALLEGGKAGFSIVSLVGVTPLINWMA